MGLLYAKPKKFYINRITACLKLTILAMGFEIREKDCSDSNGNEHFVRPSLLNEFWMNGTIDITQEFEDIIPDLHCSRHLLEERDGNDEVTVKLSMTLTS